MQKYLNFSSCHRYADVRLAWSRDEIARCVYADASAPAGRRDHVVVEGGGGDGRGGDLLGQCGNLGTIFWIRIVGAGSLYQDRENVGKI